MDLETRKSVLSRWAPGVKMKTESKRVLVVEDEKEIRQLISIHLKREGFEVEEVGDGELATRCMNSNRYHLVILDWMLPGMSGLEVTRWIRSRNDFDRVPILFVTAKVEPEHIATGLDAGADDYITKPFDTLVLMARVNALVRRNEWLSRKEEVEASSQATEVLRAGALQLVPDSFEAWLADEKLDLTRSEFRLLLSLLSHQGRVLSRHKLIEVIQGEGVNVVGRTVDTHVFGLRKKLGDHANLIETIRGVGYRVKFSATAENG